MEVHADAQLQERIFVVESDLYNSDSRRADFMVKKRVIQFKDFKSANIGYTLLDDNHGNDTFFMGLAYFFASPITMLIDLAIFAFDGRE